MSIGSCMALNNLFLNNHQLEGIIPYSVLQLPNIDVMDLSHNLLTGIEESSTGYSFKLVLDVSCNRIDFDVIHDAFKKVAFTLVH